MYGVNPIPPEEREGEDGAKRGGGNGGGGDGGAGGSVPLGAVPGLSWWEGVPIAGKHAKDMKRSTPTQQPTIPWSSLLQ